MPGVISHIPPFEMQVLEIMQRRAGEPRFTENGIANAPFSDCSIASYGAEIYGEEWGGAIRGVSNPKINAALGRLRTKGLVERQYGGGGGRWGIWFLTDAGRELMGLEPTSE